MLFRATRSFANGQGFAIVPVAAGGRSFASRAATPPRADGREYPHYGIGQPILAAPLVWIGNGLARLGGDGAWSRAYGRQPYGPDQLGFAPTAAELAPRWACSWFNVLLGAAMAVLVYLLCLETAGSERAATAATLLYALGSLAWPHSRTFFTEQLAGFCLLFAFYGLLRATRRGPVKWCAVAGCAAGWAFLTRNDAVLAYPGLALMMLGPIVAAARAQGRSFWPAWIAFAAPVVCAGAWQLLLNRLRYGSFLASATATRRRGCISRRRSSRGSTDSCSARARGCSLLAGAGAEFLRLGRAGQGVARAASGARLGAGADDPGAAGRHVEVAELAGRLVLGPAPHLPDSRVPGRAAGGVAGRRVGPCGADRGACLSDRRRRGATARRGRQLQRVLPCVLSLARRPQRLLRPLRPADQQYWSNYYTLLWRERPDAQPQPLRFLFPPAPIQNSIYFPQQTVWAGYPALIRRGRVDNFWLRLAGGAP